MARASAHMARQNSTLVSAENFQYAVAGQIDVGRAKVLNNFNPATPGTLAPGHVTVAATNILGDPLIVDRVEELETWLSSQALASLTVHVIPTNYNLFDLTVTVRKAASAEALLVEEDCETALRRAISYRAWQWEPKLTGFKLVSILSQVPGVAEVVTVPADRTFTGAAVIPQLGTVTVNVLD